MKIICCSAPKKSQSNNTLTKGRVFRQEATNTEPTAENGVKSITEDGGEEVMDE
jgi:hypothetical protein